jgi:hypothetical protein
MPNEELDDLETEDALFEARAEKVRVELPLTRARKLLAREDLDPGIREPLETAIDSQFPSTEALREQVERALAHKYGQPHGGSR